ncbi:MAG: DUF4214 domain-containing protein [Acidobacteria bacterium]|nr:DUF4214 domain-containing protein [Acidobacteriota bacterium]
MGLPNHTLRSSRLRAVVLGIAFLVSVCALPGTGTLTYAQSATPTPTATPSPTPGATPTPTPAGGEVEVEADLAGAILNGILPRGEAQFEIEAGGREFRVRVEDVNLPAGTVLNVLVDNARVGSLTLDNQMRGELRLKTENGQTVPPINSRTRVVVTNQAGATIIAGSFSNIPQPVPNPGPAPMPTPGPTGEIRIESRLAGAAINGLVPKGQAKFLVRADGRRKLNVEVEKVNLPVGTILNVFVNNVNVGQITLAATLENELELETERGQTVPNITTASTIAVTGPQGATILSGVFNTAGLPIAGKDIDDRQFFVEQHYRDFFDREADDSGLEFWKGQIAQCGADAGCVERARINTSGAFFLSIEFQQTGYMLYRFHKASFAAMPRRNDFIVDMQAIAQGVVVGAPGWEQKLEDNKRAAAARFVNRQDFRDRFERLSDDGFVDELFRNAGVAPTQAEREDLLGGLRTGRETRASVLRKVSENAAFSKKEFNPAFVLMQYFGYLHRNPDEGADHDLSGFNFWLKKLDDNGGDFHRAEMVKAFIASGEYRGRFDW